ncbi:MAG: type II secretion system minor pseudopilin GspJ [Magnetococcales bacterium]|nr:type II secretion system minor pseudopilin GspJ [Magnetococcales bacterium]
MNGSSRGGFTLLELLAALAVFAVMSAMAYGGLSSLLQTRQEGQRRLDALAGLQTFFIHLSRDVEQTWPRSILDGNNGVRPAFSGIDGASRFLELTRGGRPNPRGVARSGMERVAYSLEEGRILRHAWPTLDRVNEEEPKGEVLLEEVAEVEVRFLGLDGKWVLAWPPVGSGPGEIASMTTLPRALEIVVEKRGWGRIRRLFELMGGG